jgi:hypothetical protein
MKQRPVLKLSAESFTADPRARHEAFVDAFGQYLFWIRAEAMNRARQFVESPDSRNELGAMKRELYERAATLSPSDQETAFQLAQATVDRFARLFLTMISGRGFEDRIGPDHVLRFRLVMEVCDATDGDVELEVDVNRDGEKFFPDYWGRWLNRFGTTAKPDTLE